MKFNKGRCSVAKLSHKNENDHLLKLYSRPLQQHGNCMQKDMFSQAQSTRLYKILYSNWSIWKFSRTLKNQKALRSLLNKNEKKICKDKSRKNSKLCVFSIPLWLCGIKYILYYLYIIKIYLYYLIPKVLILK